MDDSVLVARLFLGLVFAFSSLTKLRDPHGFARGIERFGLLPARFSEGAAIVLILIEAAVALTLLTGVASPVGLTVAIALVLLFTGLMIQNARRDVPLPCYCFGTGDSPTHPKGVLVRLVLLLITALLVLLRWAAEGSATLTQRPSIAAILLALAMMVLGSWFLQLPDLREWHRTPMPLFANPGNRVVLRSVPLDRPHVPEGERP